MQYLSLALAALITAPIGAAPAPSARQPQPRPKPSAKAGPVKAGPVKTAPVKAAPAKTSAPAAAPKPSPSPERYSDVRIHAFTAVLSVGDPLPLRVTGRGEDGRVLNLTARAAWMVEPEGCGRVDPFSRLEGLQPGFARVTATIGETASETLEVQVLEEGRPDWTVTHIERLPRATEAPDGFKPGDTELWCAHVKNYGTRAGEPVTVEWRVDGEPVARGTLPPLPRFASTELLMSRKWDGRARVIELVVDPENLIPEDSERNNHLKVHSEARAVGFWVEESTLRYFHRHQRDLEAGSNSWEDWAQRQVAAWNRWSEATAWLRADPKAPPVRWRLDRVVVVADGRLPMAGDHAETRPDPRARSVDFMFGFPAASPTPELRYPDTASRVLGNDFYYHASLFRAALLAAAERSAPPAAAVRGLGPAPPAP
jgi:hypothetical protein